MSSLEISKILRSITFFLEKGKRVFDIGNNITLKSNKGSASNKEKRKYVISNDNSNLDKEKIAFLAKKFNMFFRRNINSLGGTRRDSLSGRDSRKGKKVEKSNDEGDKQQSRSHINHFKCFKCRMLGQIGT